MKRRLVLLLTLILLAGTWSPTSAATAEVRPVLRPAGAAGGGPASFGTAVKGTTPTGAGPAATAYDASTDTVYVANGFSPNKVPNVGGNTVSVIDGRRCDARSVSRCRGPWPTVTVGNEPSAVAADPSHHTLFVSSSTDGTLSVVDTRACRSGATTGCASAVVATVPIAAGAYGMYVDAAAHTVYVTAFEANSVSIVDSASCNAAHPSGCPTDAAPSFAVPDGPGDIDLNHRTHTAYVATLTGLNALDTRTCNATTRTGCADQGHFTICDGCYGPFAAKVDESTNTVYEGNGDQVIAAIDGRACNADDLVGCESTPYGSVDLHGPGFAHVLGLVVDDALDSVYVLSHKDDHVFMIDTTRCNGSHRAGCASLVPDAVHTGTNPQGIGLDPVHHTLYVANHLDASLSVIDAARCSATDRSGCRRLPARVRLDSPEGIAVSESTHTAYVATGGGRVSMVDVRSCNIVHVSGCSRRHPSVEVAGDPVAIAVDEPRHTAYVADARGSVSVLDTRACNAHPSDCAVVGTLAVPQGSPGDIAVNPATRTVYVAVGRAADTDVVVAFDASACNAESTSGCGRPGGVMPIGPASDCGGDPAATSRLALAVDEPTDTVFAAQIPCDESVVADSVRVLDGRRCHGGDLSGCRGPVASVVAGEDPFGLAVDARTRTLYAPLLRNGEDRGAVAVIDVRSCNGTTTRGCGQVPALAPAGFGSIGVAVDERRHTAYVTDDEDASVAVIDGRTCRAGRTAGCARSVTFLPTDDYPGASIGLAPSVRTAYVGSPSQGTVSVLPMPRP